MLSTSFRNTLLTATAITAGVLLAGPAFAGTTDTVEVGGTVTTTLSVTSADVVGINTSLPMTAGAQILKISDLTMETNNSTGYTLTIPQGNLVNPDSVAIPFQVVVVADGAATPAGGAFLVASGTDYTYDTAAANAALTGARDLYILYTPAALQDPGLYAADVSLTIADNN